MQTPLYFVGPKRDVEFDVVIDVGPDPVDSFECEVVDANIHPESKVVVWVPGVLPDGKTMPQWEAESIRFCLWLNEGSMGVKIITQAAPLSGKYVIRYTVQ